MVGSRPGWRWRWPSSGWPRRSPRRRPSTRPTPRSAVGRAGRPPVWPGSTRRGGHRLTVVALHPSKHLPLTLPLRYLGVPDEMIDPVDEVLQPMADAGYSRNDNPLSPVRNVDPAAPDPVQTALKGGGQDPGAPGPIDRPGPDHSRQPRWFSGAGRGPAPRWHRLTQAGCNDSAIFLDDGL